MATPAQLKALAKGRATRAANAKKKKAKTASPKAKKLSVPLTKAGKPDKRFVTATKATSKVTKKAPTKRTQKRRAKPRVAGYSANPVSWFMVLKSGNKRIGVWSGKLWNDNAANAYVFKTLESLKEALPKAMLVTPSKYGIEAVSLGKPEAGTRKNNPVPASKSLKAKQAIELYEDFTGHKADYYQNVDVDWPDVGLQVGECDGILYSTVRDGVAEKYIHRFKKSARPVLSASHDGASLALIGGDFRFTNRGIVDN
jgi:hypothetical protein